MALGTATVVKRSEAGGSGTLRADVLQFLGDSTYLTASGGTPDFQAYVRDAVGRGALTIVGVIGGETGGYVVAYDVVNDGLRLYEAGADAAPLDEVADGDQSGITVQVTVLSV
jgi:hypothetical protein